jgi:hypothetical protein
MCFYEGQRQHASLADIYDQHYNHPAIAPYGTRVYWDALSTSSWVDGQWIVRAP